MTTRTWVYGRLISFEGLLQLVGDGADPQTARVFAKKSMSSAVEEHPYLVYKLGYNATEDLSDAEGFVNPERQFLQIFIHDVENQFAADYMRIDEVIAQLKLALHGQIVPEENITYVKYLETSQDLNDDTLSTVMKYVRFQIIQGGEGNGN